MQSIKNWLVENYVWIISIGIEIFIAYHVFFLSKRLTNEAKLEHKEKIKQKAKELLSKKGGTEVYLVNINRYFKDYPSNKMKRFEGYSHLKAEIKSTKFDGIEFFSSMPVEIYRKLNGELSFSGLEKDKLFNAWPVSVVPYEWIEYIDLDGDEYGYRPLFYCYFKGKTGWNFWKRLRFFGYPYKRVTYYRKSEVYDESRDSADMEYRLIDEPIYKK